MDLSQLVGKIGMMGGDTDTSFFSPSFSTSNYGQINKQTGFFSIDQSEFRCPKMARTETPSLYNTGWEKVTMNERNTLEELMRRVKGPFTPLQWMELEHQALIYKYINARAPVPTSLLVSICRNLMDPSSTATSFPNNTMGWGSMKYGRNGGDEEPGRCRRTDGKKWRCARNAMEEHKYCERHMVRNRHRSRKPVEPQTQQTLNPKRTRSFSNSSSSSATTPFMRASLNKEKEVLKSPSNLSFEPVISSNDVLNFARSSYSKNNFSFSSAIESPPHLLQDFIGELTKVKPSENSKLNEFDFTQIGPLGEILGKSSSEWATGC